ncbi:MAG: YegS/Rv2252/BmrU family lipid kinase [Candidatus Eremiobacteraeota bacterium]|nr:YegS/Rv2252/BmrU family lipid kinase [Candidatus Eremiobacteraeota bacterium]
MDATIVVNLGSRRSRGEVERIGEAARARGIEVREIRAASGGRRLRRELERARASGVPSVLVAGGDGSMTLAANVFAHSQVAIGVLPLGTGNSFAQTLGIELDLEKALDVVAGGRIAGVDLGIVNGRYFANFATVGFTAEVAAAAPNWLKRIFGPVAYVLGGLKTMVTHEAFSAEILADGERFELKTRHVIVASGRIFGRQPVLPDASPTSGKLAAFTSGGTTRTDLIRTFVAFALGMQTSLGDAHPFSAERIEVLARPPQPVDLDGERFGKTPAHFEIVRRALHVFVPADFVDLGA